MLGLGRTFWIKSGLNRAWALPHTIQFGQGPVMLLKLLNSLWFGSKVSSLAAQRYQQNLVVYSITSGKIKRWFCYLILLNEIIALRNSLYVCVVSNSMSYIKEDQWQWYFNFFFMLYLFFFFHLSLFFLLLFIICLIFFLNFV